VDIKQYYRKIREIENTLDDTYVLVKSLDTADGGKAGLISEVSRSVAAKMIVEARATLASEKDKAQYAEALSAAQEAAEKAELTKRVQVAIIADPNLQQGPKNRKGTESPNGGK